MSVVNQVLNELEQRGAHDVSEPGTFVVVPPARGNYVVHLLAIALGVSIVLAAWIWISLKQLDVIPATLPGMEGKIIYKMPLPDLAAASSVEATVPVAQAARMEASQERFKPASRLSMALSSGQVPATSTANAVQVSTPAAGVVATKPEAAARAQAEPVVVAPRSIAPAPDATPMKHVSAGQRADAEFRRAAKLMQLGRIDDAIAGYESALSLDASHDAARQALVALLLDAKRIDDAARVVMGGLNLAPENTQLTMLLARIQLDRGELDTAVTTLEKSLQYADGQPEYHAFFAALLQRQQRHEEALLQYRIVLQQAPENGLWLMGYGLSLQATKHNPEARAAFQQALDSNSLTTELQMFVKQKLKEL